MPEDNTESLDGNATNPAPFEEFVRQQFELLNKRIDRLDADLREEMKGRFVQLSRQIREPDQKVDIFIRKQLYIKDDIREPRETRLPKN
ncbi:MAG TPA: hypothetical protein VNQ79_14000 [Blastocatellia bacterium]|nr:hypothetical protein [Blastocatellia bacterium]